MQDLSILQGAAQVAPSGDWAVSDGVAARRQNLIRRLTTPRGALWYDRAYGNPAYGRLSQPATAAWLQELESDCRRTAQDEPGVSVVSVRASRQGRLISVTIAVIWDGSVADDVTVTLQGV